MKEVTLASRRLYEGRIVNLRVDTVRLEDGRVTEREIVEHRGAVAVVALDGDGNVLLVRQFRKPAERELLEIPAGTLEAEEEPASCARRELAEETGYRAGHLEPMGGFYSSPGFCTEYIHLYLATDLSPSPARAEYDEAIELVRVPLSEALRMIGRGEICDAKTIVGLLSAWARRQGLFAS
ncbi:MAG TPA: NUDIX hydrolase [Anaerolineae bacterium]|nr:NUDIX hydrolase [Anaerolineae bacterium]